MAAARFPVGGSKKFEVFGGAWRQILELVTSCAVSRSKKLRVSGGDGSSRIVIPVKGFAAGLRQQGKRGDGARAWIARRMTFRCVQVFRGKTHTECFAAGRGARGDGGGAPRMQSK